MYTVAKFFHCTSPKILWNLLNLLQEMDQDLDSVVLVKYHSAHGQGVQKDSSNYLITKYPMYHGSI